MHVARRLAESLGAVAELLDEVVAAPADGHSEPWSGSASQYGGSIAGSESMLVAFDGDDLAPTALMAEAAHGTAPSLHGKNVANPLAMILAAAALLSHTDGEQGQGDEPQPGRGAGGEGPEGGEHGDHAGQAEQRLARAPADTEIEDRARITGGGQGPGSALWPSTSAYATRSCSVSPSLSRWL